MAPFFYAVIDRIIHLIISHSNLIHFMNANYDNLPSTLMGLGFGLDPQLMPELERAIGLDQPEFTLYAEARFDDSTRIEAKLYISKSEQGRLHRLIMFDARLYYSTEPVRNRSHIFLGDSITFKEAFNLLQGRPVQKALQTPWTGKSSVWIQLHFDEKDVTGAYKLKQYSEEYNYDLEKVLEKYPIAELDDAGKKAALIVSLKEGNLAPVTAMKATKTERWAIAANPQFKVINIYPSGKYHPTARIDSDRQVYQ